MRVIRTRGSKHLRQTSRSGECQSTRDASMPCTSEHSVLVHFETMIHLLTQSRPVPYEESQNEFAMSCCIEFLMYMNLRQQLIITYCKRRCQAPLITTGCHFLHHVHDVSTCWFLCLPTGARSTWPDGPVSPSDAALAADPVVISCVIRVGKS